MKKLIQIYFGLVSVGLANMATHAQSMIKQSPNGHYYEIVAASDISWIDAATAVQSSFHEGISGHLATITTEDENIFINDLRTSFLTDHSNLDPQFWIGGFQTDNSDEPSGNWQWVNNEGPIPGNNNSSLYANWAGGEPNNCGGGEDHLTIGRLNDGTWNDEGCAWNYIGGYIIEYDAIPDSDGDGVSNDIDDCENSDLSNTIKVGEFDTGVSNVVFENGCTLADIIDAGVDECASVANNHGQFVSCMAHFLNDLVSDNVITEEEKDLIQECVGASSIGKPAKAGGKK